MTVQLNYKVPKTLLNKGSGFLSGYTHLESVHRLFLCMFLLLCQTDACLLISQGRLGKLGGCEKEASGILAKELQRARKKGKVTIFMSSSTDPYQPAEARELITRSLLETMLLHPPDFVLVQTRSPLVTRDIDLLQQLGDRVRVSMTVETDQDHIRKHFTPAAPPIAGRLHALKQLRDAGIQAQVAIAPVLPSSDQFAVTLRPLVDRVCIDDYFMGDGSEGKRTRRLGMEQLYQEIGLEQWIQPGAYKRVVEQMRTQFAENEIYISQAGFEP